MFKQRYYARNSLLDTPIKVYGRNHYARPGSIRHMWAERARMHCAMHNHVEAEACLKQMKAAASREPWMLDYPAEGTKWIKTDHMVNTESYDGYSDLVEANRKRDHAPMPCGHTVGPALDPPLKWV